MKKAQVEVQINWIFVIVAGGLILLFFFGLIRWQKSQSEQSLAYNILNDLEAIFTASGVSTKTFNTIQFPDIIVDFKCEDGRGEFRIHDSGSSKNTKNFSRSGQFRKPLWIKSNLKLTARVTICKRPHWKSKQMK